MLVLPSLDRLLVHGYVLVVLACTRQEADTGMHGASVRAKPFRPWREIKPKREAYKR